MQFSISCPNIIFLFFEKNTYRRNFFIFVISLVFIVMQQLESGVGV